MTTLVLRRARVHVSGLPVALSLAWREGLRLVRHPVFVGGAVLSLAMFGLFTWQSAPVLHRDDTTMSGALLPLAAATLIAANLAATRASRDGADELYRGVATSTEVRALGHLLSLLVAAVAAVALIAVMFVYLLLDEPVGTPRITELMVGPLTVMLLGGIGIALAGWRSHPALAPLVVVVFIAVQVQLIQPIVGNAATGVGGGRSSGPMPWFAPWTPMSLTGNVPPELVIRPSGWHALYLIGAVLAVGTAALLARRRSRVLLIALAASASLVGIASAGQTRPPSNEQRQALANLVEDPDAHQVCEERRGITYCAYPAYVGWIDRWARPIESVLDRIPPDERPEGLAVRQRFGPYFEGPTDLPPITRRAMEKADYRSIRMGNWDAVLSTGTEWGRGKLEGDYEIGLALGVSMRAVGIPTQRDEIVLTADDVASLKETLLPTMRQHQRARQEKRLIVGRQWTSCHVADQARGTVAMWLAASATDQTRATVERIAEEVPYGLYIDEESRVVHDMGAFNPLYPPLPPPAYDRIQFTDAEFHYGVQLLAQPTDEVVSVLLEDWEGLTDRATTSQSLLDRLELERLPTTEEQLADLPAGYEPSFSRLRSPEELLQGVIPCP